MTSDITLFRYRMSDGGSNGLVMKLLPHILGPTDCKCESVVLMTQPSSYSYVEVTARIGCDGGVRGGQLRRDGGMVRGEGVIHLLE